MKRWIKGGKNNNNTNHDLYHAMHQYALVKTCVRFTFPISLEIREKKIMNIDAQKLNSKLTSHLLLKSILFWYWSLILDFVLTHRALLLKCIQFRSRSASQHHFIYQRDMLKTGLLLANDTQWATIQSQWMPLHMSCVHWEDAFFSNATMPNHYQNLFHWIKWNKPSNIFELCAQFSVCLNQWSNK